MADATQLGWAQTPHRKQANRRRKPVAIYYQGTRMDTEWLLWKRYRDRNGAQAALQLIQRSYGGIFNFEIRGK